MAEFDFSAFPMLTTSRLILRETIPADAADFFSFSSDPEVQKYDSDPPLREMAEAIEMIERSREWFTSQKAISWGVELKEEHRWEISLLTPTPAHGRMTMESGQGWVHFHRSHLVIPKFIQSGGRIGARACQDHPTR